MTDIQIEKILQTLLKSDFTSYFIAQETGITEQSIINYRKNRTIPSKANAKLLEYFFNDKTVEKNNKNSKMISNSVIKNSNIVQDSNLETANKHLEECKKMIEFLKEQLEQKDKTIEYLLKNQK